MVEIENNSSDFAKALQGLLPNALAGLRGVTSPEVSYVKPAIAPFTYGAEEPALAYIHDAPEASTSAQAILTLVTDNDAAGDDAESEEVRSEATKLLSEILRMDSEIKASLGPEIALLKVAAESGRASGVNFESIRDRIASATTTAQAAKAETAEQKRAEALKEIQRLSDEIKEDIKAIDHLLTPEERARIAEAEEKERKAKEHLEWLKANGGSPEQIKAAEKAWVAVKVNEAEVSDDIAGNVADRNPQNSLAKTVQDKVSVNTDRIQENREIVDPKAFGHGYDREVSSTESFNNSESQKSTSGNDVAPVKPAFSLTAATSSLLDSVAMPAAKSNSLLEFAEASPSEPTAKNVPFAVSAATPNSPVRGA